MKLMNFLLSLRLRIYLVLTALILITLTGGTVMIYYTHRMETILNSVIDRNLSAYQAAEALETALVNQKGFVSYYFLDGDPDWLKQLGEYRQIFKQHLKEVERLAGSRQEQQAIDQIKQEYSDYIRTKDQVIAYYRDHQREIGAKLHHEVRDHFFKILNLCEDYKAIHKQRIIEARRESHRQAEQYRGIAIAAMIVDTILGLLLAMILIQQVIRPIRQLLIEANREGSTNDTTNVVKALDDSVRGLIKDAGQTYIELERSRESLLQAEKMVIVGKLSAGMAHSIRNPLTSVKMRLFSLNRSLRLTQTQKEDFQVISEEIRHIDTIVQNFLEFSRPPKLKMQRISPSVVVDSAIQLLQHRLRSYDVSIRILRDDMLPEIQADPEQLKEVIVNLVVNACEAIQKGGSIEIREELVLPRPPNRVAVISLKDNGPGMSEAVRNKIFQPFYTTKEEGTGLGLSIAARIVEEHRGWIDVQSSEGRGTTFVINLPVKESVFE